MSKVYVKLLILSLVSAILLWTGWPPIPFPILLFFALIPLLKIEFLTRKYQLSGWMYFLLIYLTFVIWNVLTTYWIYNTTITGGILIHLVNPILLSLPLLIYRMIRKKLGETMGYVGLVSSWLCMEYFHHMWQFAFPFLTLGNGLSMYPQLVQFYEYTGVLGGSLWILLVNISVFQFLQQYEPAPILSITRLKPIVLSLVLLVVPALASFFIFISYEDKGKPVEVIAVHPNTDCRNDKYLTRVDSLVERYIRYSYEHISPTTDYVLWPETAITNARWIENLNTNELLNSIKRGLLKDYPKTKLITGAVLYELYNAKTLSENPEDVPNIRYNREEKFWFHTYNAAFQLTTGDPNLPIRTKIKLVPVEETVPYAKQFGFLRKIVRSMGGYSFDTRRVNANVFNSKNGIGATPLICYESIFGNLTAKYVDEGAQLLFVILNEGWYKNMRGASQFMYYSSLRAIENRRSIARSSNDGISCFINQRGEIQQITKEFKSTSIKGTLLANRSKTIYTIFGDYIGVVSSVITCCTILYFTISKGRFKST